MCVKNWYLVNMNPTFLEGAFNLKRKTLWDEAGDQIRGEPTEVWGKCVNLSSQLKVWGTCTEATLTLPAASGNLRDSHQHHTGQGS